MPKKKKRGSFNDLLVDKRIKAWYDDMCYSGSELTAKVYVRRIFNFKLKTKVSPFDMISKYDKDELYQLIYDFAKNEKNQGKASSYIHSELKSIYAWLKHNRITFDKIPLPKGANSTPTLKDEVIPTTEELRRIFMNAPNERDRISSVLMAFSGVRPATLGNHLGNNGLRLGNIPDLEIKGEKVVFKVMPAIIKVEGELSKTGHNYITFLCEEGCEYLKNYFENRINAGEKLSPESPIIRSEFGGRVFPVTVSIRAGIRKAMRKSGMDTRPYVLRRYFASKMVEAENNGDIIHSYSQYFLGHSGDMMATYSMNKGLLPSQIEDMRQAYERCQKYLQTIVKQPDKSEMEMDFKRSMLAMMGFSDEDINEMDLEKMTYEEISKIIFEKVKSHSETSRNGGKMIVDPDYGRHLLEDEDWDLIKELSTGEWIVKPPIDKISSLSNSLSR